MQQVRNVPSAIRGIVLAAGACWAPFAATHATTAAELRDAYAAAARVTSASYQPSTERGRSFFATKHGAEWACATCHTNDPRTEGRHAATGRAIRPLAPATNPLRLTDGRKVEKWFTRNCRDVVARECTPGEKADVLAWLVALRPGGAS